jgi:long-subunit fatty acid transport protein
VKKVKEWHLAVSALVPMSFSYEGQEGLDLPNDNNPLKIKFNQNFSEESFLVGLTAARKINDSWSAGITLFAQNYSYLSTLDFRAGIADNPDVIFQESHREKFSPLSLLAVFGIQKKFDKINLGFRATMPSIHLAGTADYYNYTYSNLDPENVETSEIDLIGEKVKFKSPTDLRIGAVYFPAEKWAVTLDLSYQFELQYNLISNPKIDKEVNFKGNYRINAGVEYLLNDKLALNGGLAYTPSTLKESEDLFGQDFTSLFLGGKSITKHFVTTIGLFYSKSKGSGYSEIANGTSTKTYEYIGLVIGTNYRF